MKITFLILLGALGSNKLVSSHLTPAYDHDSSRDFIWSDWMRNYPDDTLLSRMSIPGTHDTLSIIGKASTAGSFIPNRVYTQAWSLEGQLASGIRALDIRLRCIDDSFAIHHGSIYMRANFHDVLRAIRSFLNSNPSETVLMRVKMDHKDDNDNCTGSFVGLFHKVYWQNPEYGDYFWRDQYNLNPTLGDVRGQIVLLYDLPDPWDKLFYRYGLNYLSLDDQDQYNLVSPVERNSFDNYDKWLAIKVHLNKANGAHNSNQFFINYLSASSDAINPFTYLDRHDPCFVASGHNDCSTEGPRREAIYGGVDTGLPASVYPDFPRDGEGHILYEGMNTLTWQWIINNQPRHVGIVMADFPGFGLVEEIINCNDRQTDNNSGAAVPTIGKLIV